MENYNVLIFPSATRDLQDIVDYVNELSPQAAFQLFDEIVENMQSLSQMPLRCPLLKNPVLRLKGYRIFPVSNYLVVYVVLGQTVEIRRILYHRRNYDFLLQ